jgi:hypothetical protein
MQEKGAYVAEVVELMEYVERNGYQLTTLL